MSIGRSESSERTVCIIRDNGAASTRRRRRAPRSLAPCTPQVCDTGTPQDCGSRPSPAPSSLRGWSAPRWAAPVIGVSGVSRPPPNGSEQHISYGILVMARRRTAPSSRAPPIAGGRRMPRRPFSCGCEGPLGWLLLPCAGQQRRERHRPSAAVKNARLEPAVWINDAAQRSYYGWHSDAGHRSYCCGPTS